ncbi:uncharacterized protein LOC124159200 isoform X1 [Ischnura elegans]|uniref:uncharacterized protein LOC124159200 isoform X1 n=1 Tax=Ischnura elegans TaxID=197161 RepID=UPI001ED8A0F7|nr:uncharacterized protein LOC124159200 isoform X1 [Ischnura elegans]
MSRRQSGEMASTSEVNHGLSDNVAEGGTNYRAPSNLIFDGKFFQIVSQSEKYISAQCQLCLPVNKVVKGVVGSTSNFTRHLKLVHNALQSYNKYKSQKNAKRTGEIQQKKITNFVSSKCMRVKINNEMLNKDIMHYIIHSMKPVRTVEDENFMRMFQRKFSQASKWLREFIDNTMNSVMVFLTFLMTSYINFFLIHSVFTLCADVFYPLIDIDPSVQIMSRRTMGRKLNLMFENVNQNLASKFTEIQFMTSTADIWSTKHRSFLGVTAHWINDETLTRESAVLSCVRFKGTHDYKNIADTLLNIFISFGLNNEKVATMITDNGSNFVKAFKEFGCSEIINIDSDDLPMHEDDSDIEELCIDLNFGSINMACEDLEEDRFLPKHLRCFSHTLSLIATTDLTKILKNSQSLVNRLHKSVMAKCSYIWNASRKPKSSEIITEILDCSLVYPCPTRWNSLFDAVSQIVKLRPKMNDVLRKLDMKQLFSDTEFDYMEEFIACLRPIAQAIDVLQSGNSCFYGQLLPTLFSIRKKLADQLEKPLLYTLYLIPELLTALNTRFGKYYNLSPEVNDAILAAAFHPQFKMLWLPNNVSDIDSKRITNLCLNCLEEVKNNGTPSIHSNSEEDSDFYV